MGYVLFASGLSFNDFFALNSLRLIGKLSRDDHVRDTLPRFM